MSRQTIGPGPGGEELGPFGDPDRHRNRRLRERRQRRRRRMQQVSSNLTLMLRLFFPVLLGVFFGALTVYLWVDRRAYYGPIDGTALRLVVTAAYLGLMAFFYLTVWRLRRVEMSRDWVYVTDYFRQARYPWTNVAGVTETPLGFLRLVRVRFHAPGSFGESALFVASGSRWRLFKEEHPGKWASTESEE